MGGKRKECALSLPSVTYAMSAQRLLAEAGIAARVVSVDPALTKKGCSHGIALDCMSIHRAKEILTHYSLPAGEVTGYGDS